MNTENKSIAEEELVELGSEGGEEESEGGDEAPEDGGQPRRFTAAPSHNHRRQERSYAKRHCR